MQSGTHRQPGPNRSYRPVIAFCSHDVRPPSRGAGPGCWLADFSAALRLKLAQPGAGRLSAGHAGARARKTAAGAGCAIGTHAGRCSRIPGSEKLSLNAEEGREKRPSRSLASLRFALGERRLANRDQQVLADSSDEHIVLVLEPS